MSALKQWVDRRRQPVQKPVTYGPIGVYFTQEHLHLVQLENLDDGGIGLRCRQALTYPGTRAELLASPGAVCNLIRRALRAGKFRGRLVVSAMPPEQVRAMSVSYPANTSGNAAASIAKLMADRLDGALSDYVIDFLPIRMSSRDGDRLALVAVSRLEDVNKYLDSLGSAGLHVDYLETGPLAIKRLIEAGAAAELQDNVIVINTGDTTSHVTTISGKRLLADQEVQFGEEPVINAISNALEVTTSVAKNLLLTNGLDSTRQDTVVIDNNFDTDVAATLIEIVQPELLKLVREIDRAFLFADSETHGDGQKRIFVVGGMAQWPGAVSLLSSLAKMPVESLGREQMPFAADASSIDALNDRQAAEMSTAVGLALRGMLADE